jgi:hypothetical protein
MAVRWGLIGLTRVGKVAVFEEHFWRLRNAYALHAVMVPAGVLLDPPFRILILSICATAKADKVD